MERTYFNKNDPVESVFELKTHTILTKDYRSNYNRALSRGYKEHAAWWASLMLEAHLNYMFVVKFEAGLALKNGWKSAMKAAEDQEKEMRAEYKKLYL